MPLFPWLLELRGPLLVFGRHGECVAIVSVNCCLSISLPIANAQDVAIPKDQSSGAPGATEPGFVCSGQKQRETCAMPMFIPANLRGCCPNLHMIQSDSLV